MKCLPKPICLPTPFVGAESTARLVRLKYCQADLIRIQMAADMNMLLISPKKLADFPLKAQQCLHLIQCIEGQQPTTPPPCCCMEISVRLTEEDIYQIQRWRVWVENHLADIASKTPETTDWGRVALGKIEKTYEQMNDIRRRLVAPLKKGDG